MRARALFAGTVGALLLAVATPAAAKFAIAGAHIRGPGLEGGGLRLSTPAAERLWGSAIALAGGLDDARFGSVEELAVTAAQLGPKYLVTYGIHAGGTPGKVVVRQELYPYAEGGPVTYTPPGQGIDQDQPWGAAISPGWYQGRQGSFRFLVKQGLPETSPVVDADHDSATDTVPTAAPMRWGWIAVALAALVAVSVLAPRVRRRVVAVARAHR